MGKGRLPGLSSTHCTGKKEVKSKNRTKIRRATSGTLDNAQTHALAGTSLPTATTSFSHRERRSQRSAEHSTPLPTSICGSKHNRCRT